DAHLCRRVARHHRGARRPIRRTAVAERRLSDLRDPHGAPARGERRDSGRRVFVRAGAVGPRGAERRVSDRPRVPSVVAGLLLLGAAFARGLLGQAGQISYEAFTLPNGLRVIYSEDHSTPLVSVDAWPEADRLRSLAITDEHFQNQRETVKEERRLRVDNQPYSPAFIDGMTWPFDSARCFAYAHTVIGSMDDLNAAQLSDVRAFFDTY